VRCRATIDASEGERHRSVGSEESARVLIQRSRHIHFATGELPVGETRPLFEEQHTTSVGDELAELLRRRSAAGTGADDDDVVFALNHELVSRHVVPTNSPPTRDNRGRAPPRRERSSP